MTNFRRQLLIKALKFFDLGVLAFTYIVAAAEVWHLTEFSSFTSFISIRVKVINVVLIVGLFYSWHVIFRTFGLYRSRRLSDRKQEVVDVLKASSVAALVLAIAATLFHVRMVTLPFILVFWGMSTLILTVCRFSMRQFLASVRSRGHNLRHVLIVGTNNRAREFAHTIDERPELGYQLLGFADDEWDESREFKRNGGKIVTSLNHFADFLRERVVDEVVIALPMKSLYSESASIVATCQEQGVIVRILNSIFDLQTGRMNNRPLERTAMATFIPSLSEGWPMLCKRLLDVLASAFFLILLAPVFLVVALLIKFDSSGPVFFVQERIGLNKRRFRMFKFRTMVGDAEQKQIALEGMNEVSGPVFKIKNDPRITRLGGFLRKTSIDELPQFFNVLIGDMSLVGPRPLPVRDYLGFEQDWQRRRFSVRPGLTCLWQIHGRSGISFEQWMHLDMRYIDRWSLWLDFEILVKTLPAVLRGNGAA